ncbi:MAG: SirB1 family protein [Oscillatoria sp. PMC 1068.18]|nr:SirB1 family protein [Oscillatoria sp. PMC 1076.18]MEC4989019.1 SirB1 family protein [Oscillatoria sp. PMC 1068.18]
MNFYLGRENFTREINQPETQIDLAKAALYIAQEEYLDLDPEEYLNALDTMAKEVRKRLPDTSYPMKIIQTINSYLYDDLGFQGNSDDYYSPQNSFLNEVIDNRAGIPITLSLVYLEIAKRIDFPMVGIGMPGHFIIRPEFENAGIFVDPFEGGEILFEQDCEERLSEIYQQPVKLEPIFVEPVTGKQFIARMLTNLKFIYLNQQELGKGLGIVERLLLLFPEHPIELRDRGLLNYQLNGYTNAAEDFQKYLELLPDAEDAETIRALLINIRRLGIGY